MKQLLLVAVSVVDRRPAAAGSSATKLVGRDMTAPCHSRRSISEDGRVAAGAVGRFV
jgi:hypothetical protein